MFQIDISILQSNQDSDDELYEPFTHYFGSTVLDEFLYNHIYVVPVLYFKAWSLSC